MKTNPTGSTVWTEPQGSGAAAAAEDVFLVQTGTNTFALTDEDMTDVSMIALGDNVMLAYSGAAPASPLTANRVVEYALDEGTGQVAYNAVGAMTPDDNLFGSPEQAFSGPGTFTGFQWVPSGFTVTDRYSGRASRFVCASGALNFCYQVVNLPAGTYTISAKVQSNTGSTQKIRMSGNNTGTMSSDLTVPTGSPTVVSYTFVHPGGSQGIHPIINSAAADALDILVFWAKLNPGSSSTAYVDPASDLTFGFNRGVESSKDPSWVTEGVSTQGTRFGQTVPLTQPALSQVSLYAVAKFDGPDQLDGYSPLLSDDYGTDAKLVLELGGSAAASSRNATFTFSSQAAVANVAHLCDSTWHLITGTYDGTTLRFYVDGCELASTTAAGLTAVTVKRLFLSNLNNVAYFAGSIAYVAMYDVGHTAAQVLAQLEAYATIMAFRGITIQPLTKLVAFEGDSISDFNVAGLYPRVAMRSFTGAQARDFAVSGSDIAAMNGRATSVDALYDATRSKNILHVLIGRNDLAATTAAAFFASLKTYCQARRAVGWKIVLGTILPSTLSGFNTKRNAANALIYADTSFYDALSDFAANATMGPDAAASNATYYPDGTHPSAAGHAILGPIAAAAVQSLL